MRDVITAWNMYMEFLYMLGGIRLPTKVHFSLSTLAGESRYDIFVGNLQSPACTVHSSCMYKVSSVICPISYKEI